MTQQSAPISVYYEQLAPDYDRDRFGNSYGRYIHAAETAVLERLLKGRSQPTLDLACGTGRLLQFATHGADQSPAMITEALKKHPGKELKIASATALPWPDGYFQNIICFHLFMHLDTNTIGTLLDECYRVLQPGGLMIFDIPSAKRRRLLKQSPNGWHGAFSMTICDVRQLAADQWTMQQVTGILMLPVHRLPAGLRPLCRVPDRLLCRSWLKEYASYMALALQKKAT